MKFANLDKDSIPAEVGVEDWVRKYSPFRGRDSPEIWCEYSSEETCTVEQVKYLVCGGLVGRCRVFHDGRYYRGTLYDIVAEVGRMALPMGREGLIVMYWTEKYGSTPFGVLGKKMIAGYSSVVFAERPQINFFPQLDGPTIGHVSFWEGKSRTGEKYLIEEIEYFVSHEKAEYGRELKLPTMLYGVWYSRLLGALTSSAAEISTYVSEGMEYAGQYLDKHRKFMQAIVAPFSKDQIVELGAGAGIVCSFRDDVIAGDLYPPKGANPVVQQESFSQTIHRGERDAVIVCAYIRNFMTERDLKLLEGRKVVWVDTVKRPLPGRQIAPGISYENIPADRVPSSVPYGEEGTTDEHIWYTENLLNRESYMIFRESEYTAYLRVMRPFMTLVPLPGYTGGFRDSGSSDCILAVTVGEVLRALSECKGKRIYFAQVGKEVETVYQAVDLLIAPGAISVHYERRQIYDVTVIKHLFVGCALERVGERYYFYDRAAQDVCQHKERRTATEKVKYQLVGLEKISGHALTRFSVSGDRLYVDAKPLITQFTFRGKRIDLYTVLHRLFPTPPPERLLKELVELHNKQGGERIGGEELVSLQLLGEEHWVLGRNSVYLKFG